MNLPEDYMKVLTNDGYDAARLKFGIPKEEVDKAIRDATDEELKRYCAHCAP